MALPAASSPCRVALVFLAIVPQTAHQTEDGKYPPAEPGALRSEPLKAAIRYGETVHITEVPIVLARGPWPRNCWKSDTTRRPATCASALMLVHHRTLTMNMMLRQRHVQPGTTTANVKLLLPPRQSRGTSLWGLACLMTSTQVARTDGRSSAASIVPTQSAKRRGRRRRFYEKPSERANREQAEAIRRSRKAARKKAQREGLIAAPPEKKKVPHGRPSGRGPFSVTGRVQRQPGL
jgi:hypothetical protein